MAFILDGKKILCDMIERNKIRILIYLLTLYNCAAPTYQKLSIEDPGKLLFIKDSLLIKYGQTKPLLESFVRAHNSFGISAMGKRDYSVAIDHFNQSKELIPSDTIAKYNILMAEGHLLYEKSNKDGLWDAIEKYSQAARLYDHFGEPYYHMGLAYRKIGNTDFDLILESYDKALVRTLTNKTRADVEVSKQKAVDRKKTLDDFWK